MPFTAAPNPPSYVVFTGQLPSIVFQFVSQLDEELYHTFESNVLVPMDVRTLRILPLGRGRSSIQSSATSGKVEVVPASVQLLEAVAQFVLHFNTKLTLRL